MTDFLEMENLSKFYGNIIALTGVTTTVNPGEVTCVLGDNGAGKSTFIKILAGVHQHDEGKLLLEGAEVKFASPREALSAGIATVYQDLAMVPLMSVWRNFFLGQEPRKGVWPFRQLDIDKAKTIAKEEMAKMGIDIRDTEQSVGTLSGGERQSVAIARASYFGARVLILDEPTSALGVKQSGVVLRRIVEARDQGLAVIFITHNPHHAYPVGDRFVILKRGPRPRQLGQGGAVPGGAHPAHGRRRRIGATPARTGRGRHRLRVIAHGCPPPPAPRVAATSAEAA